MNEVAFIIIIIIIFFFLRGFLMQKGRMLFVHPMSIFFSLLILIMTISVDMLKFYYI